MMDGVNLIPKESGQRKRDALVEKEKNLFDEIRLSVAEKQFKVLEKLFEIEAIPNTKTELTEMLGVSRMTWYTWLKDPLFRSCLYRVGQSRFAADDPLINETLAKMAKGGNLGAIRLIKELSGLLPIQRKEVQTQIQINYNDIDKVG